MPLDIPGLQSQVQTLIGRIEDYKIILEMEASEYTLPLPNLLTEAATVNNAATTVGAQLASVLAPKTAALATDVQTLSDTLRGDALTLIGIDGNANPTVLQPTVPFATALPDDPESVVTWLTTLMDLVARLNAVFG